MLSTLQCPNLLLGVCELSTASLGVKVLVAKNTIVSPIVLQSVCRSVWVYLEMTPGSFWRGEDVPLVSPLDDVVTGNHGRQPEEDLVLGAAEDVEDGVVAGAGEGVLSVGGDTVVDDALLLGSACEVCVSCCCVVEV